MTAGSPAQPVYRCLDFAFSVSATDPALRDLVDRLFSWFRHDGEPSVHFSLVEWGRSDAEGNSFALYGNATFLRSMREPDIALAHLVWEINQAAVASSTGRWLLHAAAAERDGEAVLLAAPSGSGKSTLVTALVARGYGYLTDDVAVVDPRARRVLPFPKPIGFDRRARHLMPELPEIDATIDRYIGPDGFLTAGDLGGTVGPVSALRAVVVPTYRPGGTDQIREIAAEKALSVLRQQSFAPPANAADPDTEALWDGLLNGVSCYELAHSSPPPLVAEMIDEAW